VGFWGGGGELALLIVEKTGESTYRRVGVYFTENRTFVIENGVKALLDNTT
jgi:hypothetical protein